MQPSRPVSCLLITRGAEHAPSTAFSSGWDLCPVKWGYVGGRGYPWISSLYNALFRGYGGGKGSPPPPPPPSTVRSPWSMSWAWYFLGTHALRHPLPWLVLERSLWSSGWFTGSIELSASICHFGGVRFLTEALLC